MLTTAYLEQETATLIAVEAVYTLHRIREETYIALLLCFFLFYY